MSYEKEHVLVGVTSTVGPPVVHGPVVLYLYNDDTSTSFTAWWSHPFLGHISVTSVILTTSQRYLHKFPRL